MPDLTTTEAAERLKLTKRSVARLIKRGQIEAEKRGRDWFIEEAEIERYERARRGPGRPKEKE